MIYRMQHMNDKELYKQVNEFSRIWHQLLVLDQKMDLEQYYSEFLQMTINEINVISLCSEKPDIILKDISKMLDLPKSTLTNIINRLEEKGYLFRTITKKDLRSYGLCLTEKGMQVQKEHLEYESEVFIAVLETLEEGERKELIRLMNKILVKASKTP